MESKTARASAVRTIKEVHIETTEEAIKAIRDNRAGGLHIGDMSRVDKLLEAFDKVLFANGELTNALNDETSKVLTLEKESNTLKRLILYDKSLPLVKDDTTVVMAEVDNSEIGGEA